MDTSQILAQEANNTDKIILLREGMFWKAYERSAFQICTTIEPFQTSKKAIKKLGGTDIISIGFPDITEERLFGGFELVKEEDTMRVYMAKSMVDEGSFMAWKSKDPVNKRKKGDDDVFAVIDRIQMFDVGASTPIECMMLLVELKRMIANVDTYHP